MLLTPDPVIALMREQRDRDLAIVAVVCSMADGLDEAVRRLTVLRDLTREQRASHDGRLRTDAYRLAVNTDELVGPLLRLVTQLRDREAAAPAPTPTEG